MRRSLQAALAIVAAMVVGLRAESPRVRDAAVAVRQEHRFTLAEAGEVVATITAGCGQCDWGANGREAVALRVLLDGRYSQHLLLVRGEAPAPYRIMLGALPAGDHRMMLQRDAVLSGKDAGDFHVQSIAISAFAANRPEHAWLAQAPILHARPGTVERFSDVPVLMWVERALAPAAGFNYSMIFTHEDGGTPTDRLMATWGRTTDIEFVFGVEETGDGTVRETFQGASHDILPFRGAREGRHPLLWVSTDNNMFSDHGPDAIRFALAPEMVTLTDVSREVVMDANPWTYALMAAELRREDRIDPGARPGSAKVPDVRQFAYIEACGEADRATFAFDVAAGGPAGLDWYASDRGDPRFRIARSGCVRAAVPLGPDTRPEDLRGIRIRAYTRPARDGEAALPPGKGRVTLRRLNTVFMLDAAYRPRPLPLQWIGVIEAHGEAAPVQVPVR
ncbi:MAG: hypothetical protein WD690_13165 [Vicinamibacterales bacterium]